MIEQIKIGDEVKEIEVKPITLICPSASMSFGPPIEYPNRFVIDPETTVYHAQRVQKLHADFVKYWLLFFKNISNPITVDVAKITPDEIRRMGMGSIHLMGLIDLTLKLTDKGIPVVLKYPETYMHPAWQVAIPDFVIALIKP